MSKEACIAAAKYFFFYNQRWPSTEELKTMLHKAGIIMMGPGQKAVDSFLLEQIEIAKGGSL